MVVDMDGEKRKRSPCSREEPVTVKKTVKDGKKKCADIPERVTLKKEIGLLSACTIIIGKIRILVLHLRINYGVDVSVLKAQLYV